MSKVEQTKREHSQGEQSQKRHQSWQPTADVATLLARASYLEQMRAFFSARELAEVQTPMLGRDTVTDPDIDAIAVPGHGYLQTSPEYFMKRLLAAGIPSCYQLGPAFRQDESGRHHNPEFTLLEWYRLGFDDAQLMTEVGALVDVVLGPGEYSQVTYWSLVESRGCARDAPREMLDLAFAEACAELNPGRYFVLAYPSDQAALARVRMGDDGENVAARFELVIDGLEIANGYYELLDADEHRDRFREDRRIRAERGLKDILPDETFLDALTHGLPACAGVALGVDRLLMLALGKTHIREVLAFADRDP